MFEDQTGDGDQASGTTYVLHSKSDDPVVVANREILHKIGVRAGNVERRIANARLDPTFLIADVEIVATYELYNVNRAKLENLIHKVFGAALRMWKLKIVSVSPSFPTNGFSCLCLPSMRL